MITKEAESLQNQLITIRDYIRWAVSEFNKAQLFFGHGIDSAWNEADYLVLHALHLPPGTSNEVFSANLLMSERIKIIELIQRRVHERKPAAYLTQEAWFAGLSFYVDERVIIPRSPMAELIENGFEPWLNADNPLAILDLCTGSGCIAIACAMAFPQAQVDAVDISDDALAVAKINVQHYQLEHRMELIKSDLFTQLAGKKYDLIISNPPYVTEAEMIALPQEYKHEPTLALAAGKQGLDIVATILQSAHQYLNEHGILIVEVGNSAENLIAEFPTLPFTWLEFERGGHGVFLLYKEQLIF